MASRGTEAKEKVIDAIRSAFGDKYLGVYDKKVYVLSEENGESIQVAISLTCPKTPIEPNDTTLDFGQGRDFENPNVTFSQPSSNNSVISEEERQTIAELMTRLGLQ